MMLKKFISESFFNPIFHILPIIVFLVVEDFYGIFKAWTFSFPLALLLVGYVLIFYKSIFHWHLISTLVYLLIGLIITFLKSQLIPAPYDMVIGEIVAVSFMLILFLFRSLIYRFVVSVSSKKISMENNLNELVRTTNIFAIIFSIFSIAYVFAYLNVVENLAATLTFIYQSYTLLMILVIIYELIRVSAIRGRLMKEEWLPIVNENGREIGSINYHTSLSNEHKKYMHPVVRLIVIEGNKIFLRKTSCKDDIHPAQWDNAICSHLNLNEKIAECIQRAVGKTYGITDIKPVFLANYQIENTCEVQYVHLFISCKLQDAIPNSSLTDHVKWWTIQQINEELESGIFTDNFLKEYELLKRSGLIDTGKCTCDCQLRDEIESRT